ncbi:DUF4148 domain-containing protein [Paraburkholderia strydomiana]|uniref:DUF4148 domain-containing protein n=1 Tax=Paraburkholderia strydomiana TaxID=1245417 RepID=UPI0038BE1C53
MKSLIVALVAASTAIIPSVSFAQRTRELTGAEVRAQLVAAEQQGQIPQSKTRYPDPMNMHGTTDNTSGYGAPAAGSQQAGAPLGQQLRRSSIYAHH